MQKKYKNVEEINKIKSVASVWKKCKKIIFSNLKIGNTPLDIEAEAQKVLNQHGATFSFYGYNDFPGKMCISVNEVVIHGLASNIPLKLGDKVSIDYGITLNNFICDAGFTYEISNTTPIINEIAQHTQSALWSAIKIIKNGVKLGSIAQTIEQYVKNNCPKYSIIDDFVGHGCGKQLHEEPTIFNKGLTSNQGEVLKTNMVICIEPILVNQSSGKYYIDKDGWSVKLLNHGTSAHWEHMVLIQENGCEVLTADQDELDKFMFK